MKPVAGLPITERSGTMRMVSAAVLMPAATCHEGRLQSEDSPPPPAPQSDWVQSSFQTDSLKGSMFETVKPPTPVTYGWDAGSSTASAEEGLLVSSQSDEPSSPAGRTIFWP